MTVRAGTSGKPLSSREQWRVVLLSNGFSLGSSLILKCPSTASSLSRLGDIVGISEQKEVVYICK